MAWEFVVAIIFVLLAGGVFAARARVPKTVTKRNTYRGEDAGIEANPTYEGATHIGRGLAGIALLFLFLASFTVVGTKNVGIQTSFNRPVGTMSNGWNWKAPWTDVTEWDGKLQNLRFSDTDQDDDGNGISVRLGNQSTATVDLILQYRLTTDDGVLELFRQYGDEQSLKKNLVQKALQSALNQAFKSYDPITALATTKDRTPTTGMPELAATALSSLRSDMPNGIEVVSLTIVMPHYDKQTEDRIRAFNAAIQDTAIATQREQTAAAIKRANDILAASNASTAVLYQNCLDMVERVAKSGGSLPAGFSCSASGGVVIPAVK
jgi:regulator of protease activity HflC (stomatin/prohibitin superfamily)